MTTLSLAPPGAWPLDHALRVFGHDLGADRASDEIADLADDLIVVTALTRQQVGLVLPLTVYPSGHLLMSSMLAVSIKSSINSLLFQI
jgi:hypothetical protein